VTAPGSTNQALAITVTAVNDNDPVITSAATANFAENATGTVIDRQRDRCGSSRPRP
jgi:hypothetical protein